MDPLEHLFRREGGRLLAALTRIFGVAQLALAEDVVQDALCRALETWKIRGVPDDPAAWLMATARNRALDVLRGERTAQRFAPDVARHLDSQEAVRADLEGLTSGSAMTRDQQRMMFSCCSPRLSEASQVALVLHILCGFSVSEIASAFLSHDATVKKRITRAKALLAGSHQLFELTDADFAERFNTDYHVSFTDQEAASQSGTYNYRSGGHFQVVELPGISVFYRNAGDEVFHTYSTYGRGLDMLNVAYHYLDLVPKGRDEGGGNGARWVRRRDEYEVARSA